MERIAQNGTRAHVKALDLFAGTGWGVACQRLGIKEAGVEIMPEAVATRTANGMETIYHDVWDGLQLTAEQHREQFGSYGLLIASPPCQTFSLAGKGAGRAALDEVLEAIELHAYKDAAALLAFGAAHDMRTALVLSPLAYVWRDRPKLVAMEQVPTVLPVWEACAEVMREWGYDVKVEVLNAEQYGVPQTRKRAILVARRGGPVSLPKPTHSRYYSRTPDKLDAGVQKWVSMAEALGWRGLTTRPSPTITGGGTEAGGAEPIAKYHERYTSAPGWVGATDRLTTAETAVLQSYPTGAAKNMGRGMVERYGDRPGRDISEPAFTLRASAGGTEPGGFVWENGDGTRRKLDPAEASALQSYPGGWGYTDRPAMTVTGHGMLTRCPTGQKVPAAAALEAGRFLPRPPFTLETARKQDPRETSGSCYSLTDNYHPDAVNCTPAENAILQSYEPPFIWCGTKTKQFLQIGNAVPPLLAEAILAALIGIKKGR